MITNSVVLIGVSNLIEVLTNDISFCKLETNDSNIPNEAAVIPSLIKLRPQLRKPPPLSSSSKSLLNLAISLLILSIVDCKLVILAIV